MNQQLNGIWLCDACGNIETQEREVHCWKCGLGCMNYWTGQQLEAKIHGLDEVLKDFRIVKDCCDREWDTESTTQAAYIISNAMFWRNDEIRKLRDRSDALRQTLRLVQSQLSALDTSPLAEKIDKVLEKYA
jgi:hypothetical protein